MTKKAKTVAKKSRDKKEEDTTGYTLDDVARAERLLHAVKEALPVIENILKTTSEWQKRPGGNDYDLEPPPLLKQSASYRDAVDPETFKQFNHLVDFLRDALFGVDCDNDSAVRFAIVDLGREEDFLPSARVPRVSNRASIAKRYQQLNLAKMNTNRERISTMERCFEMDLNKIIERDDLQAKAKDCKTCKGKGWIETDHDTWHALDYGAKCRTRDIGCDFSAKPKDKYYKIFRLFCECQEESEDEEDGEDGN